jgi:hypothetical protein
MKYAQLLNMFNGKKLLVQVQSPLIKKKVAILLTGNSTSQQQKESTDRRDLQASPLIRLEVLCCLNLHPSSSFEFCFTLKFMACMTQQKYEHLSAFPGPNLCFLLAVTIDVLHTLALLTLHAGFNLT